MATKQAAAKSELIENLHQVTTQKGTGYFTVRTENQKTILIGIDSGRLTRLRCGSMTTDAIFDLLAEISSCNYDFIETSDQDQDKPELFSVESFMLRITKRDITHGDNKEQMIKLAAVHIGVAAEIIVNEACESSHDIQTIIDHVASSIPDEKKAGAFKTDAYQKFVLG